MGAFSVGGFLPNILNLPRSAKLGTLCARRRFPVRHAGIIPGRVMKAETERGIGLRVLSPERFYFGPQQADPRRAE